MQKIEIAVKKFFAGLGYGGYPAKFLDGGIINFRISKNVLKSPKPETMKVTLEWDDVAGGEVKE